MSRQTFLWHDYETWGVSPQKDHPSQFAAIRTDEDFNEIGQPANFYCQIPNDYLPHPQACLITGISPLQAQRDGYCQADFANKVHYWMSQPNTCVVGYNSVRFDDEVTRYTFYRNFIEPYGREWQNGNSRWDIIDMVRTCYALRPEGIEWPQREDGSPSFRLELLTQANGISHANAHDALSDVRATIAMAKLVKQQQPKLFSYLFNLRNKRAVAAQIDTNNQTPLVHVSSKLPASQGCCTLVMPICLHPTQQNAVILVDLNKEPDALMSLTSEQIKQKLYLRQEQLAPGEQRVPIKLLHTNKCPVVAPLSTLSDQRAAQLGIDKAACLARWQKLKAMPELQQKLKDVFDQDYENSPIDPDYALYSGGFFSDADRYRMDQILASSPEQLSGQQWQFDDPRLSLMLFRYRARNFPHTLNHQEMEKWQAHRQARLVDSKGEYGLNLEQFYAELELLTQQYQQDKVKMRILKDLYSYGQHL